MAREGKEHGGREVLSNLMFRERADQEGRQVALGQSILEIDQDSRADSQAPLCEQGIEIRLRVRVDQQ